MIIHHCLRLSHLPAHNRRPSSIHPDLGQHDRVRDGAEDVVQEQPRISSEILEWVAVTDIVVVVAIVFIFE